MFISIYSQTCTKNKTVLQLDICNYPEIPTSLLSYPLLISSTRRGDFHLLCPKNHTRLSPTTTHHLPETVHWRAQRSRGRRRERGWWLPREQRQFARTQQQRALTALRFTFLKLRQGYEDINMDILRLAKSTQVHTPDIKQNMYDCPHQVTVGQTNVNILVIDFFL